MKIAYFLALQLLACTAVAGDHVLPRSYFQNARESNFDQVQLGQSVARVRKLCEGSEYLPFETARGGFAFAVDSSGRGILALPSQIGADQKADFFTSKKRVLVAFYDNVKVNGIMVFSFETGKWDNRSEFKGPKDASK
jgi:hypothetical protein